MCFQYWYLPSILYITVKSVAFLVETVQWFPIEFGINPYSTSWPTDIHNKPFTHISNLVSRLLSTLPNNSQSFLKIIKPVFSFFLPSSSPLYLHNRQVWWLCAWLTKLGFLDFPSVNSSTLALDNRYFLYETWKVIMKQQAHFFTLWMMI